MAAIITEGKFHPYMLLSLFHFAYDVCECSVMCVYMWAQGAAHTDADSSWTTSEQRECVRDNAVVFQNLLRDATQWSVYIQSNIYSHYLVCSIELLRNYAESTLVDMVQLLFIQLPSFSDDQYTVDDSASIIDQVISIPAQQQLHIN